MNKKLVEAIIEHFKENIYSNSSGEVVVKDGGKFEFEVNYDRYEATVRGEDAHKIVIHEDGGKDFLLEDKEYMFCGRHNRYDFNDTDINVKDYDTKEELEEAIKERYTGATILPLYMYEHSGIALSTTPFSCPWDSGRLGFVIMTKEMAQDRGLETKEQIEEAIKNGVEYWNKVESETLWYVSYEIAKICSCCERDGEFEESENISCFQDEMTKDVVNLIADQD